MILGKVLRFNWCLCLLSLFALPFTVYAQVEVVATKKLEIEINEHLLKLPYFSNYPIHLYNPEVRSAIIVVHGTNRNADTYFENMQVAASLRPNDSDSTLIIAPQFLIEEDIGFHNLDQTHLYWSNGGWKSGSNSLNTATNPRPERIPSYAVLDSLLLRVSQNFSQLKSIVVTGHSAGGQVANRYSAASPMIDLLCENYNVSTKFVVANPSSYLYLDNNRRVEESLDQFEIPNTTCAEYNHWKYGLEDLYSYPSNIGALAIRENLANREVVYLLGGNDNDSESSSLDVSCKAMLQGNHRLERGQVYLEYLKDYYSEDISEFHSLDIVLGVGHSNLGMYTSSIGLYHLFESPPNSCGTVTSIRPGRLKQSDFFTYPNPTKGTIYLKMPNGLKTIRIFDMYGRLIEEIVIRDSVYEMDLAGLTDGIYIVEYKGIQSAGRSLIFLTDSF